MSVNLFSEDELRAALRPYRADPNDFEAGVRAKLEAAEKQQRDEPLARLSPWIRSAAAFLPLEVLAGCKGTAAAAKLAPAGGGYKLLGYLAFPAMSVFVLLGATIFSVAKIRSIQDQNASGLSDQEAITTALREWWRRHKWGAMAVFAATMLLMVVGATWILFLFYLVSFGLLLLVLASFAKLGLGNRQVIGRACGMGLMFLSQATGMVGIGNWEIHFVDQILVSAIFLAGSLVLLLFVMGNSPLVGWRVEKTPRWLWGFLAAQGLITLLLIGIAWSFLHSVLLVAILLVGALVPMALMIYRARMAGQVIGLVRERLAMGLLVILAFPLMVWMLNPYLWPATPSRMKSYVESFDEVRLGSANWQQWEIVAQWAIDSKLDPDLSKPRELLAKEISGAQNSDILAITLGSALRLGLLPADQVGQLKNYEQQRGYLLNEPPILSLDQQDWVIRAAVLHNDLSPQQRDLLEQRLHATLENMSQDEYVVLKTALRVTLLLEVIERPIDRDEYRATIHDWLRKFHTNDTGGFRFAGGFKDHLVWPAGTWFGQPGSLEPTAYAVELMEIYGVPDDLELNWVRSFLRPSVLRFGDEKWIAAATLDRLNHLPGVTQPTWLEYLYYERTLLAATVLVGLCIYATLSAPNLKRFDPADGSLPPDPPDIAAG